MAAKKAAAKAGKADEAGAAPEKRGPGAGYHRGNVAEDLKAAARRLLKTEPLEQVSARRLCREVGVASANFYNHFASFDDLLLELAADGFAERAAKNRRIRARAVSHEAALIELAQVTVDFAVEDYEMFRIMFGQVPNREGHERYRVSSRAAFEALTEIVLDGPRPPGRPSFDAYAFFAFTNGLARLVAQGIASDFTRTRAARRDFVETVARAYFNGIRLTPPRA